VGIGRHKPIQRLSLFQSDSLMILTSGRIQHPRGALDFCFALAVTKVGGRKAMPPFGKSLTRSSFIKKPKLLSEG
jgi:hypothetical protein